MFGLILVLFITAVGVWMISKMDWAIAIMMGALFFVIMFIPAITLTGGLVPDYSSGTRDGYITKLSNKGLMWKTNEGEMQVGTGNMAALQEPFEFSVKNSTLLPSLFEASTNAQRVRLYYQEYLITDLRYAESSYLVTKVEVLDGEE